jgi:hypothetical protein
MYITNIVNHPYMYIYIYISIHVYIDTYRLNESLIIYVMSGQFSVGFVTLTCLIYVYIYIYIYMYIYIYIYI